MVIGMRSPPSRTLSMTNCPGRAAAAMSGASMRKYFVTGVSLRVSRIRAMSVRLEQRVLVHRLAPRPAPVGFVLNGLRDRGVLGRQKMTALAHELEPVRHRMAAARRVRIVGERRVTVLDLVEREKAAVDRRLQHRLRGIVRRGPEGRWPNGVE